jgi:hypothetical protein
MNEGWRDKEKQETATFEITGKSSRSVITPLTLYAEWTK